jgi:carboxypeptidase family protein
VAAKEPQYGVGEEERVRVSRVTLALGLVAGLAFTGTAQAAGSGSISGKVTDEAGLPRAGMCVAAGNIYAHEMRSTTTANDGTYTVSGLSNASFSVVFRDCTAEPRYLTEWYDNQIDYYSADPVTVTAGTAVSGIDAALTLGGFIKGTLTDDDGTPAGTCIAAHAEQDGWPDVVATAYTKEDGSYRIGPLPPGDVQVLFGDCEVYVRFERYSFPFGSIVIGITVPERAPQGYVREWYDNRRDFSGDPIAVVPGVDTLGINAVLEIAGGITGAVTDEAGEPLKSMCVIASGDVTYGFGETDENGFYAINRLAPGNYEVVFYDCYGSTYRSEWFDDQPSSILADSVAVVRKVWTNGTDAALGKRPRPDLAITGLSVSSVPLEASDVTLAGSPWLRTISVDVSNIGAALPNDEASLLIWAESMTDGNSQFIASDAALVMPGSTEHRTYDWNALGTIGDATVYASVCTYDDADRGNDVAHTHSYAGVGGLGIGIRADLLQSSGSASYCGPGVVLAKTK